MKAWAGFTAKVIPWMTPGFGPKNSNGDGPVISFIPIFRAQVAIGCFTYQEVLILPNFMITE
jgi:hypothetical protein